MAHGICGFEAGSLSECSGGSGTRSVQSTVKRTGTYALQVNPTTTAVGSVSVDFPASTGLYGYALANPVYVRFYFRADTLPGVGGTNDESIWTYGAGLPSQRVELRIGLDGTLRVYQAGTTLVATGTSVLATGTWYRIEVTCGYHATDPVPYEVKLDGTVEPNLSGTLSQVQTAIRHFIGKVSNRNGNTVDFFFDDVAVSDVGYPGEGGILALEPNAVGAVNDFDTLEPAGGNKWDKVVLPHDGDTSYVGIADDNAVGQMFGFTDAGLSGQINAVGCLLISKCTAGTICTEKLRITVGGTDFDFATGALLSATTYTPRGRCDIVSPDTSSAWTESEVDGILFGSYAYTTASTGQWRISTALLNVDYVPSTSIIPHVMHYSKQRGARV